MAGNSATPDTNPNMDYAEHEKTYAFFLRLLKYIVGVVVVILIFLAWMWG